MKRTLILASMMLGICLVSGQAGIISDTLTVYDEERIVAQIGVNEDGTTFHTGLNALQPLGGSGQCDPPQDSCPLSGLEDPWLLYYINPALTAPRP